MRARGRSAAEREALPDDGVRASDARGEAGVDTTTRGEASTPPAPPLPAPPPCERAERLALAGPKPPEGGGGVGVAAGGDGSERGDAVQGDAVDDGRAADGGIWGAGGRRARGSAAGVDGSAVEAQGGGRTWRRAFEAAVGEPPKMAAFAPWSGTARPLPLPSGTSLRSRVRRPAGVATAMALRLKPPAAACLVAAGVARLAAENAAALDDVLGMRLLSMQRPRSSVFVLRYVWERPTP